MKSGYSFLAVLSSLAVHSAALTLAAVKPPAFFLAGDSTTAVQSTGGGGWGSGFLNTTLKNGATGKNFGHNGATTVSFREGGDWANVLKAAKAAVPSYVPYVTIQFGHNDQKPAKNISMAEFTANLVAFVKEVRAIPATPILVTSLSRRKFSSSTNQVSLSLADVTAATKDAAAKSGAAIIDLNTASTNYLNKIGATNAATYNLNADDFTHLNDEGSVVFGNMVAMLIDAEIPSVQKYVVPRADVAKAIKDGKYIFTL
ncbi:carbohydrate esterase family 12 protein [Dothidotthia symphoricarpi CBS 119687]|uniref:Carbohydrate esterase family 12 protein n=1 Tax=Dothidotthia symphoricarpi CBS 119687 TaxID=1392245 RepID=A0A6A6A7M4_9PLEO|nr:carbohydrate esterase family 12 protein [Dothidotthia symphoricarpi CBS 119687]KAF2127840.1 carbohydrate esterase family 12 protein [Dothidotthia symphoricarpi CBS 119687]